MTGQGRTLVALGGVLVAAIGAAVWLAMGGGADTDVAGSATNASEATVAADAAGKSAEGAKKRPKPKGSASIVGEVRRSKGKVPVADQEVQLVPEKGDPWSVKTDDHGAFKLPEIPHGGPYELRVAAPGCGTIHIPGIALERNEKRDVGTLWLDPSVSVSVQVRTWSDQPVEGALVEAFAVAQQDNFDWTKMYSQMAQAPIAVAKAKTDAKGEASFPEIAVGRWTFTAGKDGFARVGRAGVTLRSDVPPSPVKLYLGKGNALSGRVLDAAKAPVAGASLLIGANAGWDPSNAPLRARATSDAEGRYAFAALEAGDAAMLVARPGGVPANVATLRIPNVTHFDVLLKATATLTGTVTEKDGGKPVEGAVVRGWSTAAAEATTDAQGKYSLVIAEGAVSQVTAEKEGFVSADDPNRPKPPVPVRAGETATRDILLVAGAKVTGVVKGPEGPLAGAKVWVYVAPAGGMARGNYSQKSATTDAEGRYEAGPLAAGKAVVQVVAPGYYVKDLPENWFQLLQGSGASPLKFDVPAGGVAVRDVEVVRGVPVDGRVDGPEGPLAGVRVSQPADMEGGVTTGADGTFRIEGVKPSNSVWLYGVRDGYFPSDNKAFTVTADTPTTGIVLKMVRAAVVKGTITTTDGAALTEAKVSVMSWADGNERMTPYNYNYSRNNTNTYAPVRPDGTYEIQVAGVPSGKFRVTATAPDRPTTPSENQSMTEGLSEYVVNLTMDGGKDFEGRVTSKQGGAGVPGALVSIQSRGASGTVTRSVGMMQMEAARAGGGGSTVWAVTDSDGRFALAHLASGNYGVTARADGYVAGSAMVDLATSRQVTVEIEPEMSIEGVVTFVDGTAVEGAYVSATAEQAAGSGAEGKVQSAGGWSSTGVGGRFRMSGLASGPYRLTVTANWQSDLNVKTKRTDPIAAGTTDVKIVVEPGGVISGRVLDAAKKGVGGIYVYASIEAKEGRSNDGNDNRNAQTKDDGSFSLVGLSDGATYLVNVQPNQGWDMSGGQNFKNVSLPGIVVGTKGLDIVLDEGLSITGVLVGADGKPIPNAYLYCNFTMSDGKRRQNRNSMTDSNGAFTFGGLDAGDCQIMMQDMPSGPYAGLVVDNGDKVAAGSKDVRLVAAKGLTVTGSVADDGGGAMKNAWVNANPKSGGRSRGARVKDDGTFEITGLAAGASYTIAASAPGYVAVNKAEDVAPGANGVRLSLRKGLEASGKVLDEAGNPVRQGQLMVNSTTDPGQGQSTQTDEAGKFTVKGLLDGMYTAQVFVPQSGNKGYRPCGSFKAGDTGVELRIQP